MFVSRNEQAKAICRMVLQCGRHCGAKDDRGRVLYEYDRKVYAVNFARHTAVCLGSWSEFRERCFRTGKRYNFACNITVVGDPL